MLLINYFSNSLLCLLHSTSSSFKNDSPHGSNPHLAASSIATDSTLELKKEMDLARDTQDSQDPHLAATLPRDQAPHSYHYVSANVLSGRQSSTPSEDSQDYLGRSQSQPLETAMWWTGHELFKINGKTIFMLFILVKFETNVYLLLLLADEQWMNM